MAEQLRVLIVPAGDLGWIPIGVNQVTTASNPSSRGASSSDFCWHCTHVVHRQAGRHLHTHAHIININNNIFFQKEI